MLKRVLIVGNNFLMNSLIYKVIKEDQMEIIMVNLDGAKKIKKTEMFDLVIIDLDIQKKTYLMLIRKLAKLAKKVILIVDKKIKKPTYVDYIINKPFLINDLKGIVNGV